MPQILPAWVIPCPDGSILPAAISFRSLLPITHAMMPQMKLSNYAKVLVGARISKSGTVKAESGDLIGEIENVATNTNDQIKLTISKRIP